MSIHLTSVGFTCVHQPIQTVTLNGIGGNTSQMSNGTHNVFRLTVNANTSIAHNNVPTNTRYWFELHLNWVSGSISFPTTWTKGESVAFLAPGNHVIQGVTVDGGASWIILVIPE